MAKSDTDVRAGGAYVEIGGDKSVLDKDLANATKTIKQWGKGLAKLGVFTSAIGGAMTAPIITSLKKYVDYGSSVYATAKKLGFAVTETSKLAYILKLAGSEVENMMMAMRGLSKFTLELKKGSKEATQTMKDLGISTEEYLEASPEKRFWMVIEGLHGVEDQTLRVAYATQFFSRAALSLIGLTNKTSEEITDLKNEASLLGVVLTEEDAKSAREVKLWMTRLSEAVKGISNVIGILFAPRAKMVIQYLTAWLIVVREYLAVNPQLLEGLARMGFTLTAIGIALTAVAAGLVLVGTSVFWIGIIVVALIALLDMLGIVDTGFGTLFQSIKIGGNSISAWWQAIGDLLLAGIVRIGEHWAAMWDDSIAIFKLALIGCKMIWNSFMDWLAGFGIPVAKFSQSNEELRKEGASIAKERKDNTEAIDKRYEEKVDAVGKMLAEDAKKPGLFQQLKVGADEIMKRFQNLGTPSVESPEEDESTGVPEKMGVRGFFGGSLAAENMGEAFAGKGVDNQQLDEMKRMNDRLDSIDTRLRKGQTIKFA